MLADNPDRAGLWALVPFLVGDNETHLRSFLQPPETAVEDGMAMKIDLVFGRSADKTVALIGKQAGDDAMRFDFMLFDLAAKTARAVFQAPGGGGEGIADGDVVILVGLMQGGATIDPDASARQDKLNTD